MGRCAKRYREVSEVRDISVLSCIFGKNCTAMSSLVFHVEADALDNKVIDSIKAFFGGKKIQIAVQSENPNLMTEDELLAKIERGRAADHEYHFSPDELKNFIETAIETGEMSGEPFRRPVSHKVPQAV
jgi:hypothetical protein